jgi:hypothetical protein
VLFQERLKLIHVEIAEHKAVHLDDGHERLSA